MESKIVKLKSKDNQIYEVSIDLLEKAKLISGIVEDASDEDDTIFLREIDEINLIRIIDYLVHYQKEEPKEIPKPFPDRTDDAFLRSILNDDWTFDYIQNMTLDEAINLVNAANYLQIDGLQNILAAKIAHEMCNCDGEEARRKFGIEGDMTEEEIVEYDNYPLD